MNPSSATSTNQPLRHLITTENGAVDRDAVNYYGARQPMTCTHSDIGIFSGHRHADPLRWLADFERHSRYLTDEGRLESLRHLFEGTARYWYLDDIEGVVTDYQTFKRKFYERFVDVDQREHSLQRLRNMQFCPDVAVIDFVTDYRHFYKIAYPEASVRQLLYDLFERFSANFRSRFVRIKTLDEILDLQHFLKIAKKVQTSFKIDSEADTFACAVKVSERAQPVASSEITTILEVVKTMQKEIESLKSTVAEMNVKRCYKCKQPWPGCGCAKKCHKCSGPWPCDCRMRKANANPGFSAPGNDSGLPQ